MSNGTVNLDLLDIYNSDSRNNIINLLIFKKNQGETLRNLSRELLIPVPTLLWHIKILENFGFITKFKIKREIVIIHTEFSNDFYYELNLLELTFKSSKAKLVYNYLLTLEKDQPLNVKSILMFTSWSTRTLLRYFSKLVELGIIEKNFHGKGYILSPKFYSKFENLDS